MRRNYKGQVPLTVERALDDLYDGMDRVLSALATQDSKLSAQGERVVQVEKQASALAQPFINSNNTASPDPNLLTQGTGSGNGTVTSVALSVPSIFTVAGSPVATSGTLSFSLNTQTANTVFAGPSSGSAAAPTFRALDARDLYTITPALLASVSVNLNTTSAQDLYTVPAGKTLIALIAVFRAPSVNISGVVLGLSIQDNSGNGFWQFDNSMLAGSTKLTSVLLADNTQTGVGTLVTATNKVQAKCASAFGSAATATIDLFGVLY